VVATAAGVGTGALVGWDGAGGVSSRSEKIGIAAFAAFPEGAEAIAAWVARASADKRNSKITLNGTCQEEHLSLTPRFSGVICATGTVPTVLTASFRRPKPLRRFLLAIRVLARR